jgi:hypothetical protein
VLRSISSVLVIGTQSNYLLDGVSPIIARISSSKLGMLHVSICTNLCKNIHTRDNMNLIRMLYLFSNK